MPEMSSGTWVKPDLYDGRTEIERSIIEFIDEYPGETLSEVSYSVGCRVIKVRDLVSELVRNQRAVITGGVGNDRRVILVTGNATAERVRDYVQAHPGATDLEITEGLGAASAEIAHLIRHMRTAGSLYAHDDANFGYGHFTSRQVDGMIGSFRHLQSLGWDMSSIARLPKWVMDLGHRSAPGAD